MRSLIVSPSPLIIFPATQVIASCNAPTGPTIAFCAAIPAKPAAIGFKVAVNVFAKTAE